MGRRSGRWRRSWVDLLQDMSVPISTQEVTVFVASPGDCEEERRRVRTVVEALNTTVSSQWALRLRVTGWEGVPPDLGRPQEQINPLVDSCDVFIGILGQRWGGATGTHSSGFVEEFERAVERRGSGSRPRIALYFRTAPPQMAADPGPQLEAVLSFRRTIRDQHSLLYGEFTSPDDLGSQLWELLLGEVVRMVGPPGQQAPEGTSTGPSASDLAAGTRLETTELDDARRQIAAVTDAITGLARDEPRKDPVDPDRLLLIALSLNDSAGFIPAHVANRLFRRRGELALSVAEAGLWLRSAVADIGRNTSRVNRVIPGWALVSPTEHELPEQELLNLLMSVDDEVAVGVFRLLHRLRARPAGLWQLDDESSSNVVERWVTALRRPSVSSVAIEYLASLVESADARLLDALCEANEEAPLAELRALVAGNPSSMAKAVASSYAPAGWKVAAVSDALPAVDDEALGALAGGRGVPAELRRKALVELDRRNLMTEALLETLLTDSDMVDAVFAAVENPRSPDTPGNLLPIVRRLPSEVTNRLDLEARAIAAASTTEDLLALLDTDVTLEPGAVAPTAPLLPLEALGWKRDPRLVERARAIFDTDAEDYVAPLEADESWTPDLLSFLRDRARLTALRVLATCEPIAEEDRARVRAEVSRGDDLLTHREALELLASIATADDVPHLLAQLTSTLIGSKEHRIVVDAVLAAGGVDAARKLVQSDWSIDAVRGVTALGADPAVNDAELRELLYSPRGRVRLAALEQLDKRLDGGGLATLLEEYPSTRDSYYYNVVTELDFMLHSPSIGPRQSASTTTQFDREASAPTEDPTTTTS